MSDENTMGVPVPQKGSLSYAAYLKVPELIRLQQCLSDPKEHDETLFIIIHQVYELWFKQILHEAGTIIDLLDADRVEETLGLLRRVHRIQRLLVSQIGVLETMAPGDFLRFRDHLNPASGFQSFQFREFEYVCGLKDDRYLDYYAGEPDLRKRLEKRLAEPTLAEAWERLLRRRGLDLPELPAGLDPAERARLKERRIASILSVYTGRDRDHDLYQLAESLIELDENLLAWRWHHVAMVERMIGRKQGTGGSEGVGYLQSTLSKRCFPELWEVRTHLGT